MNYKSSLLPVRGKLAHLDSQNHPGYHYISLMLSVPDRFRQLLTEPEE